MNIKIAVFLILTFFSLSALAQIPRTLNYQGKLTASDGVAINDPDRLIAFELYDAGLSGSLMWAETLSVNIVKGLFDVRLGTVHPLALPFDQPYWMQLKVDQNDDGDVTDLSDEILLPRDPFSAVPYAFRSILTDSVEGVNYINFVDSVTYIDSVNYIDSVAFIDYISYIDSITHIDSISYINFISFIDSIGIIDSIVFIDSINVIDSISFIEFISYIDSISYIDTVSFIDFISYIDSIVHIESIRLIDSIAYIDFISYIDSIRAIDSISFVDFISFIDSIGYIDSIGFTGHANWADSASWAGHVHWDSISGVPPGFEDGDDVGFTRIKSESGAWLYDDAIITAGDNITLTQYGNFIVIHADSGGEIGSWQDYGNYIEADSCAGVRIYKDRPGVAKPGKIDANYIDPVFQIREQQYATWMAENIGLWVEVIGEAQLENGIFRVDIAQQPEASDLWLFYNVVAENTILPFVTPQDEAYLTARVEGSVLIVKAMMGDPNAGFSYRLCGRRIDEAATPPEEINKRGEEDPAKAFIDTDKFNRDGTVR
ncbi:hypothetical protein JW877_05990 [bacterium]|nr:hypothetical protein [bacterium]